MYNSVCVFHVYCQVFHEMDCLREEETVPLFWSFWCSELCSVDQMAKFKEGVCWM